MGRKMRNNVNPDSAIGSLRNFYCSNIGFQALFKTVLALLAIGIAISVKLVSFSSIRQQGSITTFETVIIIIATVIFTLFIAGSFFGFSWDARNIKENRRLQGNEKKLKKSLDLRIKISWQIEEIIKRKTDTLSWFLKNEGNGFSAGDFISKAVIPAVQMRQALAGIRRLFMDEYSNSNIKATLMLPEDKSNLKIGFWEYPPGAAPCSKDESFGMHNTVAGFVWQRRKIKVIPNILDEIKKEESIFQLRRRGEPHEKSMIAFPIFDDICIKDFKHLVGVINITADKVNTFQEEKAGEYSNTLQHFADRLILENRLLIIKSRMKEMSS